jgi:hypothetical protein
MENGTVPSGISAILGLLQPVIMNPAIKNIEKSFFM